MEKIAGPKARVELRFYDVIPGLIGSRLMAEYEYSYDDVRGDRHKAGARFRIPFGSGGHRSLAAASPDSKSLALRPSQPLTRQERRILDGIERADIYTSLAPGEQLREQVGNYLTGVIFEKVAYAGPGDDLSEISADQSDYTLIIVNGTLVTTETEDIQGVQTIQGGGSTIPVFGVRSRRVADFTAPGAKAFIDSSVVGTAVLTLQGNHTHIAGLDIDGNRTKSDDIISDGISVGSNKSADPIGPGTWNIVIDQTDIHDVGNDNYGAGIALLDNNAYVLIFNETSITDADFGILAGDHNTNVLITGVDVSTMDKDGIVFTGWNSNIVISDTTVTDVGWAGIGFLNDNHDIQITDVDISNPATEGIHLDEGNSNVEISEATIDGAGTDGIMNYINNAVRIINTTITASNIGISIGQQPAEHKFNGGGNDVTIANSTIDGAAEDGLRVIGNDPNTITMTNTTFTGAFGDDVIDIRLGGNTLSDDGNVFDGTFGGGGAFCEVSGEQTGSFAFDVGPQPTCP